MHELTICKDGKAEMAYVGAAPWHGLASVVGIVALVVMLEIVK